MMRIIKEVRLLIRRDLILGFHHIRYRLGLAFLFIVLMVIFSVYHFKQYALVTNTSLPNYTITDFIASLFRGVDFNFVHDPGMQFPFMWVVLMIICPFIIGDYSRNDIHNQSSMLFIRIHSRFSVWFSKFLFSIFTVILFYMILLTMTFLITFIFFSFSFEWGEYSATNIKPLLTTNISAFSFTIQATLLPLFISMVLSVTVKLN